MPAEIVVAVPDPPAPPRGFALAGFQVYELDRPYGSSFDLGPDVLPEAVTKWVEEGTERFALLAVSSRTHRLGDTVKTSRFRRTGTDAGWQPWT